MTKGGQDLSFYLILSHWGDGNVCVILKMILPTTQYPASPQWGIGLLLTEVRMTPTKSAML